MAVKKRKSSPKVRDPEVLSRELEEQLRHAHLLLEVSRKIASVETLDEMLELLIEVATEEIGAERGSLFLNDEKNGELYSRVAMGNLRREIRIVNTTGVVGYAFQSGEGLLIHDAYADPHFDQSVDQQTGFTTRNIICAPVRTPRGKLIGIIELLNKRKGRFTRKDLHLLEAMTTQAAIALQSTQLIDEVRISREQEHEFLRLIVDVTSELELGSVLRKVMSEATRMLEADRSTLFINDEKTNELFARVAQGTKVGEIRFPNHLGIAGTVFTSGESINIPYAYADLRFNPGFDKQTGYFTRSMLCVPVINKEGKVIGVTQALNKKGGTFSEDDETRLRAFTAQIAIALENAKLFEDVQNMKNYNESILESMSAGVLTIDDNRRVVTCNAAGERILGVPARDAIGGQLEALLEGEENAWVLERVERVESGAEPEVALDAELLLHGEKHSVNLTTYPLIGSEGDRLGCMLMVEDISSEKRIKATMSRYMDPGLADQLLEGGGDLLGGASVEATVLFSDIRGFTTLTEELGAQGTVALLNEYFSLMVECIQEHEGMLDKFIGDAIMAAFGIPVPVEDDEDRGVRTAIEMMRVLNQWNAERVEAGKLPIDIGVGLNTDLIVSGNIGSPRRMDYTMIGDGVNLASRLEGANKQYGTKILITENTYKGLRGAYRVRPIDHVVVKGKTEPVEIFEVLDFHTEESFPNVMEVLGHFQAGRAKYAAQEWAGAVDAFNEALALNPNDKLSTLYIERCDYFKANPPGEEWDGVWTMKTK